MSTTVDTKKLMLVSLLLDDNEINQLYKEGSGPSGRHKKSDCPYQGLISFGMFIPDWYAVSADHCPKKYPIHLVFLLAFCSYFGS